MKLILWTAAEEVASKSEAEVITVEEADVTAEEDFMVDVENKSKIAAEAGKNRDINSPDPIQEWYSVTMARR